MSLLNYKTLCLVNPASANGRTRKAWLKTEQALAKRGIKLDVYFTKGPGDATIETRKALQNGYERIISVGGDGTLNEVARIFDSNQHPLIRKPVFFYTHGHGGDFSRMFGLNSDLSIYVAVD